MYCNGKEMNLAEYLDAVIDPDRQEYLVEEEEINAIFDYLSSMGEFTQADIVTLSNLGYCPEDFTGDEDAI